MERRRSEEVLRAADAHPFSSGAPELQEESSTEVEDKDQEIKHIPPVNVITEDIDLENRCDYCFAKIVPPDNPTQHTQTCVQTAFQSRS
jgi:hypothetical protein